MGRLSREEGQWLQDANNLDACTDEQERRHLTYMLEACKERKSMCDLTFPASGPDSQLREMRIFRRRQAVRSISQASGEWCTAKCYSGEAFV